MFLLDIQTSAATNWVQIITLLIVIFLLALSLWGHWRA